MDAVYYAKTKEGKLSLPVEDHNRQVSEVAGEYGESVNLPVLAKLGGFYHDTGKISDDFKKVLLKQLVHVDHAMGGAALLCYINRTARCFPDVLPEVVGSHHRRHVSYGKMEPYLKNIVAGLSQDVPSGKQASLCGTKDMAQVLGYMAKHFGKNELCPAGIERCPQYGSRWKAKLGRLVMARLLLSCVTDADCSCSAYWDDGDASVLSDFSSRIYADEALDKLYQLRAEAAKKLVSVNIRTMRNIVWDNCMRAGGSDSRFFTLTAPTGAAKTFGLLLFGLLRVKYGKAKRLIFLLPYLNLTDEMAAIIKSIVPDVLIDTSTQQLSEEQRLQAVKWNAPCIVTTTVQFFDSFYTDNVPDMRKLHSVGDSVLLFDEIQSLPYHLSKIGSETLYMLQESYNVTVVLSTATQPVFGAVPDVDFHPTEIIQDVPGLFQLAVKKKTEFRSSPVAMSELAREAGCYDNVCVICNMKRHARAVYDAWKAEGLSDIYCLTTDLCPADRQCMIQEIREKQRAGVSVHVVATQCIEAGVDLDFVKMYRALAPLAALIQALGRMNRNGVYPDETFVVFVPEIEGSHKNYPDAGYEKQAVMSKLFLLKGADIQDPDVIRQYYQDLFSGYQNDAKLEQALMVCDYAEFAKQAKMISQSGHQVVVPSRYDVAGFSLFRDKVFNGTVTYRDIASVGKFMVNSYDEPGILSHCQEVIVHRNGQDVHTGLHILLNGHEGCYNYEKGLTFSENGVEYII